MRCLAAIYDEPTRAAKVALYAPFVGTDYIPRSWIQAALFICAGGHVFANTKVFRTKLRKKTKRPTAPILTSTTAPLR